MLRLHNAKTKAKKRTLAKKRQRSRAKIRRRTTHLAVDDVHGARVGLAADSAVPTPGGGNGEALPSIVRSTTININGVPPNNQLGMTTETVRSSFLSPAQHLADPMPPGQGKGHQQ